MPAQHITEITEKLIMERLGSITGCQVSWAGPRPVGDEDWDDLAYGRALSLQIEEIYEMAQRHELIGETAQEEVDMAISIASEPEGMPDNGIVELRF